MQAPLIRCDLAIGESAQSKRVLPAWNESASCDYLLVQATDLAVLDWLVAAVEWRNAIIPNCGERQPETGGGCCDESDLAVRAR
jgi:hypothetical protein